MKKKIFDFKKYELAQIIDALTCPVNRHATRTEHDCDDWHLHKHPELLLTHYIEQGGATEFAKRRNEFVKEVDIKPDDLVDNNAIVHI